MALKNKGKIYITTDWHLGHFNIIEYCGRPKDYETKIISGLSVLTGDDILIHLGDVCFGDVHNWHVCAVSWLPCRKWLVLGNHDHKTSTWYLNNGWDFVCKSFIMDFEGQRVGFSHDFSDNTHDCNISISGHIHEKTIAEVEHGAHNPKRFVLSLERHGYRPHLLSNIIKLHNNK